MVELTHSRHSVGQSAYHLVFRPKYNIAVFRNPWVRGFCERTLREIATKYGMEMHEIKVMPDHVHIFVEIPPSLSVSQAFKLLKGGSARAILKKCPIWKNRLSIHGRQLHLWSPGKFFRSVGNVNADIIQNYIANSNKWEFDYLDRAQRTLVP